jgi:hypothetical protein
MRLASGVIGCAVLFAAMSGAAHAQGGGAADEKARAIEGGGITVSGWEGKVDANAERQGQSVKDSKFAPEAGGFRITTGPAIDYWNPKNMGKGDYTVSATFNEPKFMNLNTHPHPYGVFIAGNDMGTPQQSMLYCAAYGNGTFIVRGFGPAPFQLGGARPQQNDAVHKAEGAGSAVSQTIALSVKGDTVSCSINGTVVATYPKSEVVGEGKLKSTDGVVGLRSAHNTDVVVTDFKVSK